MEQGDFYSSENCFLEHHLRECISLIQQQVVRNDTVVMQQQQIYLFRTIVNDFTYTYGILPLPHQLFLISLLKLTHTHTQSCYEKPQNHKLPCLITTKNLYIFSANIGDSFHKHWGHWINLNQLIWLMDFPLQDVKCTNITRVTIVTAELMLICKVSHSQEHQCHGLHFWSCDI